MPGVPRSRAPGRAAQTSSRAPGVSEALILSTCNRVEIIVATDDGADPLAIVDAFLAGFPLRLAGLHRAAPLPARGRDGHPPPVPRGRQPGFHGGGRAADSGPAQDGLRRGQAERGAVRLAGRPADARLQRRQARALGNGHRADGGFGELRRRGAGAQDFRLARQPDGHDRRARGRCPNWPRATCAARAPRTCSSPTGPTSAPSKWPSCSRARRSNRRAFRPCCPRWTS